MNKKFKDVDNIDRSCGIDFCMKHFRIDQSGRIFEVKDKEEKKNETMVE